MVDKNCHKDHRKRMRTRLLNSDRDTFEDHEILEMLLYYSVPRKDTNALAHTLLDRFGSFRGIIEADPKELMSIPMIAEHSVVFFSLISEFMRRYLCEEENNAVKYDTIEKIGEYFIKKYIGVNTETVYVMLLDNSLRLVECKKVHEGSVNSAGFDIRKIYQYATAKNVPNIVLAHNHPGGVAVPTSDDINSTVILVQGCEILGLNILEHIVVAGDKYIPIMNTTNNALLKNVAKGRLG